MHFLDLDKLSPTSLRQIIDLSASMKSARRPAKGTVELDKDAPLGGKMLALVFEKPSTRTRISFDQAMRQLGGQTMILTGAEMQLGRGEAIKDTARVLSRYVDAIMLRTYAPETLEEMAEYATVPVINGLTNRTHPCQIMADIMTYEAHKGPIKGAKIAWLGDGNNVCASLIQAAAQFGFELHLACPAPLMPEAEIIAWARQHGAKIDVTHDPIEAVRGVDAVVTDAWLSMHDNESLRVRRHGLL